ncbi:MAG: tRNA (adenosine(37)-N6)-dimethylallyltransferase MiaA [Bacteroidales bacterium]
MPICMQALVEQVKISDYVNTSERKTLLVLMGATAVGKTEVSIQLAQKLSCPIISCDSRQIYQELNIGVARPSPAQLEKIKHYFIASHSVKDYYSVGRFENEALPLITQLFQQHNTLLMVGGSGLYIDAICYGIDELPPVDKHLREKLNIQLQQNGLEDLQKDLQRLDPTFYNEVALQNPARVLRALEVCIASGKPFSQIRKNKAKLRNFEIKFIVLNRTRERLYQTINQRVDSMMNNGLLDEVKSVMPYQHLTALKTVGYRELFDYINGGSSLENAIDLIKRNTRRYAKRQLTWFARYKNAQWINLEDEP